MTEDADREEFEKFVRDNREMILRILEEDDGNSRDDMYPVDYRGYYTDRFKSDMREFGNNILRVLADEDVQKHFTVCAMEFITCVEAAIRALPLSDESRELFDEAVKAKDDAMRNVAVAGAKNVTKSKLEKISVSNVRKKIDDLFPERSSEQQDARNRKQ